jgi:hypothetical protein
MQANSAAAEGRTGNREGEERRNNWGSLRTTLFGAIRREDAAVAKMLLLCAGLSLRNHSAPRCYVGAFVSRWFGGVLQFRSTCPFPKSRLAGSPPPTPPWEAKMQKRASRVSHHARSHSQTPSSAMNSGSYLPISPANLCLRSRAIEKTFPNTCRE